VNLLTSAVLIDIPAFHIATDVGDFEVKGWKVLFKRQTNTERKKRLGGLKKNLRLMNKMQVIMDSDAPSDAALDDIQDKVEVSDDKYEKLLFDDIVGWRELVDLDGEEVPYAVKMKKELLDHEGFKQAVLGVWSLSSGGVKPEVLAEASRKN